MSQGSVITIGETLGSLTAVEGSPLIHRQMFELSIAGSESNVAIGLARLGHPVTWVSRLGEDALGRFVVSVLKGNGVDVECVMEDPGRTGIMMKSRPYGIRTRVDYFREGSAATKMGPADIRRDLFEGASIFHFSGVSLALGESMRQTISSALALARKSGCLISMDVNYRSKLWSREEAAAALGRVLSSCDIVFGGEDEIDLLMGSDYLGDGSPVIGQAGFEGELIVKRGANGAIAYVGGQRFDIDAYPVKLVDEVGAGDAFVAGYLSATLDELGTEMRLERGARSAALAVAVRGDWEGSPTRSELGLLDYADQTER